MIAWRYVVSFLILSVPLQALAGQGRTGAPPKMTPEQRAAAQAKLAAQTAELNSEPLDPARAQLRHDVLITSDSVAAATATASLIARAQSTKSVGVERSQARRLRGQCAAAQRSAAVTLNAIAALNTPDPEGTKLLTEYRSALVEVGRRMGECDKMLGRNAAGPSSAQITAAVGLVDAVAMRHDRALYNLMRGLEVPLR